MIDEIFVISNALVCSPNLSVYTTEERYQQTLETIASIDKYCPNNKKIMFDASATRPDEKYFKSIADSNVTVLYTGEDQDIRFLSSNGVKSPAEAISFLLTLNWIKQNDIRSRRIYKISGRYKLNDLFVPGLEHNGKYVFTVPTKTWMSAERITQTGVDHVYQSRLFHFDYDLLDQVIETMPSIINDCIQLNIDIEHGYYKYFHKHQPIEMPIIGLCGNLAPNGESINE